MSSGPRFLTLTDVAEELAVSDSQAYALVRSGDLPAIQVGGRGVWRVERVKLEEYITGAYAKARTDTTQDNITQDGITQDAIDTGGNTTGGGGE